MELVDLYDENRIPLGRTAQRYSRREKGTYRLIVHVCIFDHRGRLLIQRRAKEKRLWPEKWDLSAPAVSAPGIPPEPPPSGKWPRSWAFPFIWRASAPCAP